MMRQVSADPRDGSFRIPAGQSPRRLDRALRAARPDLSWSVVRDLVQRGKVTVGGDIVLDPGLPVPGGATVVISVHGARVPPRPTLALDPGRIVHQDRHVVVVDKPAGLPTVPWGDERDALDARLRATLGGAVRLVHRLDRDTTGLLMVARTADAERHLQQQLRRHTVHRRYLAVVHGEVRAGTIRSLLADDRGDGLRGSIDNAALGKEAITHVVVRERLRGATLIECRLETGRTHQIRIHLAEAGHMLLGERGYVRDHAGPVLEAPRILLHAAELGFVHPVRETTLRFARPMPGDMAAVVARLRP